MQRLQMCNMVCIYQTKTKRHQSANADQYAPTLMCIGSSVAMSGLKGRGALCLLTSDISEVIDWAFGVAGNISSGIDWGDLSIGEKLLK